MAKKIYAGVDGNARKVKKIYLGVGNAARKVKKVYIGVNGTACQCWASAFKFSFTGNYKFAGNPDGDWVLSILSSGKLTVYSAPTPVDIFCCGGAGNGEKGTDWNGYGGTHYDGGNGGNGGGCSYKKGIKIDNGTETVQVGNRGEASFAYGVVGKYGTGGRGGIHREYNGTSGQDGQYAFGEASFGVPGMGTGYKFGAGGGAGASGWRKDSGEEPHGSCGMGGTHGGGRGADYYAGSGYAGNGVANSGGGGGGGCGPYHPYGGYGASGIVVIRNARQ